MQICASKDRTTYLFDADLRERGDADGVENPEFGVCTRPVLSMEDSEDCSVMNVGVRRSGVHGRCGGVEEKEREEGGRGKTGETGEATGT